LLVVTGTAYGESEQRNQAELEQLRGYLAAMQDLRAEFSQEVIAPDEEIIEYASGSVVLSKPGRFRWNYREPYERVIVADGERVWFYEADLEQVTIRRMATGLGDTPAALLTGDEAALEYFKLLDTWTADGFEWLQLAPISPEADFSTVDIGFVEGELQRIEFVDRLGQRTRLTLSGIDRSPQLADSEFRFEIPAGVDVIGEDDM
jgi:outer membrane lipoprotein carrier protein